MLLKIDFSSDVPIYIQLRNEIIKAIGDGILSEGEKLPTVRALAYEAGINSMTVNKAYQLLKQEGYIITDRRNGAMVHVSRKDSVYIKKEISEKLELIVSEAKVNGIKENEIVEMIHTLYQDVSLERR